MFRKVILLVNFTFLFAQVDTLLVVDASSYNDWIYFSLETLTVVNINNPNSSLEWDLAFLRKHIKTNSGLSGTGNGGAAVDSTITWIENWDNINEIPENSEWLVDTTLNDFYDPITHTFGEGVKSPALNSWGWFDEEYHFDPTHYTFFVRLANGTDVVKFWPYGYYNQNGQGGHIQFRIESGYTLEDEGCTGSLGDINFDGAINVVDIIHLVDYVLFLPELNDCETLIADVNQDGLINVVDIVNLVDIILTN